MTPIRAILFAVPLTLAAILLTAFGFVEGESVCEPDSLAVGDTTSCEIDLENKVEDQLFVYIESQQPENVEAGGFADLRDEPVCFAVEREEETGGSGDGQTDGEEEINEPEFVCSFFLDGDASVQLDVDLKVMSGCGGGLQLAELRGIGLTGEELADALKPYKSREWMPTDEDDNLDPLALIELYAKGELPKGGEKLIQSLQMAEEDSDEDQELTAEEQEALDAVFTVTLGADIQSDVNCEDAVESDVPVDCTVHTDQGDIVCDLYNETVNATGGDSLGTVESQATATPTAIPTSTPDTTTRTDDTAGTVPLTQGTTARTNDTSESTSSGDTAGTTFGTAANSSRVNPNIATGDGSYEPGSTNWWLLIIVLTMSVGVIGVPIVFWSQRQGGDE